MKKRLRKKLHRGEFKEIGFEFRICFAPGNNKEKMTDLIDEAYWLIEQHGFYAGGDNEGFMAVQSYRVNVDEMKSKLLCALRCMPEVTDVEFGENTDAWYGA
jgi:uncharacterized protein YggL (DUF469 family)